MRHLLCSAALVTTLGLPAQTVLKPFQESPAATVSQDLGASTVKIEYHKPAVKGRKIWGELVPFGEVWRTGANDATVITFSDPVKIGGKDLAAGSYAFFALPGKDEWTLIFNKTAKQWGAYNYKASDDALRIQAKPGAAPFQEYLSYGIQVVAPERLHVDLAWEKLAVGFDVSLDVKGLYWTYLEKTLAGAKPGEATPFLQAASYCLNNDVHLDQAMGWVEHALEVKSDYRGMALKARLLNKAGKKAEAITVLGKAIDLAKAAKIPQENLDGLLKTQAEWVKK
jgi:hypothetical protein